MPCPILGVTPGAGGIVTDYTDLATLLAATGTAGARAQLLTAGGDAIGMWRYSSVLSAWVPDGLITLTAAGTDAAIGVANITDVQGTPTWSSGVVLDEGDTIGLELWTAFAASLIAGYSVEMHGTWTTVPAPVSGATTTLHAGLRHGSYSLGAGLQAAYSSVTNYALSGGRSYGDPSATVTFSGSSIAAAVPTGRADTSASVYRSTATGAVSSVGVGGVEYASGLESESSEIGAFAMSVADLEAADLVKGVVVQLGNAGTPHGLVFRAESVHVSLSEA